MRHALALLLKQFTDNEARLIGTVKFTNVDAINRIYLEQTIKTLKDAPHGSWKLVQVFDKSDTVEHQRLAHNANLKKLPESQ